MPEKMPACCDDVIGGLITITVQYPGGGDTQDGASVMYEGMGEVRIQPAGVTRTAGASSGGSVWVVEAARPVRALITFTNRCEHDPCRLFMNRCRINVTVTEVSRAIWHTFSNAFVVGDVEKNLSTGEVTGIEIVTDRNNYSVK